MENRRTMAYGNLSKSWGRLVDASVCPELDQSSRMAWENSIQGWSLERSVAVSAMPRYRCAVRTQAIRFVSPLNQTQR